MMEKTSLWLFQLVLWELDFSSSMYLEHQLERKRPEKGDGALASISWWVNFVFSLKMQIPLISFSISSDFVHLEGSKFSVCVWYVLKGIRKDESRFLCPPSLQLNLIFGSFFNSTLNYFQLGPLLFASYSQWSMVLGFSNLVLN